MGAIDSREKNSGFTIVELLIVIVIIAILAAITIVAYNGISSRAKTSSAQSAAVTADKKAEAYNADGPTGKYPLLATDLTGAATTTSYNLTGATFGTPASTAAPATLLFIKCGSGTPATQAAITSSNNVGVRFYYYDYVNGNTNSYSTAGVDTGAGIACPLT